VNALRLRAVSPLLATIVLIAIVVSAGIVVYSMISGWIDVYSSTLSIQPTSVNLVVADDKALLSVSVKNTGNKPLAGMVVTGYDDNGKPFKLALPPAEPGQTSGKTLVIPLGVWGIVLDGSGNNNHGAIYGATWANGKYGKALSFDGIDDYVEASHSESLNISEKLTVVAWVKYASPTRRFEVIVGKGRPDTVEGYWGLIQHDAGYPHFEFWDGANWYYISSYYPVQAEVWYHVAAAYDGSQMKIYVNGELKGTSAVTIPVPTNNKPLQIGKRYDGGYFHGTMDEVRIYNRAFDGGEVSFSNSNPGLPPTRGLVAWYPMDEGSNAPYAFTAGNSYALTITAYSLDGSVVAQTLTVKAAA